MIQVVKHRGIHTCIEKGKTNGACFGEHQIGIQNVANNPGLDFVKMTSFKQRRCAFSICPGTFMVSLWLYF